MKNPELRFKKEDGSDYPDYSKSKFENIVEFSSGTNVPDTPDGKYYNLTMGSVSIDGKLLPSLHTNNTDKLLNKGQLIMPNRDVGMGYVIGRSAYIDKDNTYYAGNCLYVLTMDETKIVPQYLNQYINSDIVRKMFNQIMSVSSPKQITLADTKKLEFNISTDVDEQTKIASLLSDLDIKILAQEEKIKKLKEYKSAMLAKMFPKDGQKTPEIRFDGFDDEWKECSLGSSLSLLKDGTHGTHKDASGPLLLSAKNIKDGFVQWDETDRRISYEDYEKIHSNFSLEENDILLTIVGTIGESAILKNPKGLTFQRSVAFLRPKKNILSEFLYTEIQTSIFQNELESRKSTSAQSGVYLGSLAEIPIKIPSSLDEQEKIGKYFNILDEKIDLEIQKLNKIKDFKKAVLNKILL